MVSKKPAWLKTSLPTGKHLEEFNTVKNLLKNLNLNTVCTEARCPNRSECWGCGTATVMIMGDSCTRNCRFCSIKTVAKGGPLDPLEPTHLVEAVKILKLKYIVITSVDRDDLPDLGSGHFANCITTLKKEFPKLLIEVLIPDFQGKIEFLKKIVEAKPNVIAHNIEVVKSLQKKARDARANYEQSLSVLENAKKLDQSIYTKSSIMVGLGEIQNEVLETMDDLRKSGCDMLTLGQYLQPTVKNLKVESYISPETFEFYKQKGLEKGFLYVASGPFVRSSYKAGDFYLKKVLGKEKTQF